MTHTASTTRRFVASTVLFALLLALVAIPAATALAQDYEAVGKRLKQAVSDGELTYKQAEAMMIALKMVGEGNDAAKDADHEALAEQIKAAVKAGKLTEEQAWAKWKAIQGEGAKPKAKAAKPAKPEDTQAYLKQAWAKLQSQVKAGKLSEEDAKAKMIALKAKLSNK